MDTGIHSHQISTSYHLACWMAGQMLTLQSIMTKHQVVLVPVAHFIQSQNKSSNEAQSRFGQVMEKHQLLGSIGKLGARLKDECQGYHKNKNHFHSDGSSFLVPTNFSAIANCLYATWALTSIGHASLHAVIIHRPKLTN